MSLTLTTTYENCSFQRSIYSGHTPATPQGGCPLRPPTTIGPPLGATPSSLLADQPDDQAILTEIPPIRLPVMCHVCG
jgi:hypothetical protein